MIREELVASCYKCKLHPHLDLQLFKLYSGLRIFAGLKYDYIEIIIFLINSLIFIYSRFNEAEVKALIEIILNTNEITVAISFLLIYPPLYESDNNFQKIVNWLKEKFSQAQQSILLIAIYCSSYQLQVK